MLDPCVPCVQIGESQLRRNLLDERRLLADGVNTGDIQGGAEHGDDRAREATPRADIKDSCPGSSAESSSQGVDHRQAVDHVLHQHLVGVADGSQVIGGIPAIEQIEVVQQQGRNRIVQRQLECCRGSVQPSEPFRRVRRPHWPGAGRWRLGL